MKLYIIEYLTDDGWNSSTWVGNLVFKTEDECFDYMAEQDFIEEDGLYMKMDDSNLDAIFATVKELTLKD